MNQAANNQIIELASLLIPMHGRPLLLPNVAVAEIVPFVTPAPIEGKPEWYVGNFNWRETNVPLVSFEMINSNESDEPEESARIAVLNGVGSIKSKTPFWGLIVQGIPRLVRVYAEEIGRDDEVSGPAEAMRVQVNGERAMIPNLDFIEGELLKMLD